MTASAIVIANGAAGFTGTTRAVLQCTMDGTAKTVTFTLPKTFILKSFVPVATKADGSAFMVLAGLSVSTGTYTLTFTAGDAPAAGLWEVYLIGELGRRDVSAENPNYAGSP